MHFETELDVPVTVHFDYQPAERMTRDYPGCEASVEINEVLYKGHEVEISKEDEEWLKDAAMEVLEEGNYEN